jgi:hypothetical protein
METLKLFIEENEAIPSVILGYSTDTPPTGFYDGTTIQNWDTYAWEEGLDFIQYRQQIKLQVLSIVGEDLANWDLLPQSDKLIAAKYCVPSWDPMKRINIVGNEQDAINWEELIKRTRLDRIKIVELMRKFMGGYLRLGTLTQEDSNAFYSDTKDMLLDYEGTQNNSFKVWLSDPNGFALKTYYTEERRDGLLNIINLNYGIS